MLSGRLGGGQEGVCRVGGELGAWIGIEIAAMTPSRQQIMALNTSAWDATPFSCSWLLSKSTWLVGQRAVMRVYAPLKCLWRRATSPDLHAKCKVQRPTFPIAPPRPIAALVLFLVLVSRFGNSLERITAAAMNNDQFRRLMLANAAKSGSNKNGDPSTTSTPAASTTPAAFGSRVKSSIPMTPRSVAGARVDFARQLAERNQVAEKSKKKFRTSAPKGSRFAEGYVDRAKTREEEEDERAERLKALEESLKKEEIDRETYDRLRSEIAGGDLSSTHLVKGLDFKLLERVRRGEDVYSEKQSPPGKHEEGPTGDDQTPDEDPDNILEQLESTEVKAVEKEKVQKKGQFAPATLNPGQKRSRNQILAEMKAARAAAAKAKEESSLGSRFKKIGEKKTPGTRIERDGKGREVMVIVDEDGHERRKVRKVDPKVLAEQEREDELLAASKVLGMEVPEFYRKQQEAQQAEEDGKEISIFDDVGSDYDPLAGLEGSDESSDEEGEAKDEPAKTTTTDMPPPPKPAAAGARNYFKDSKTALTSEEKYKAPSLDDPSFQAALKKAKAASALEKSEEEKKAAEREERLRKKLQEASRDDEDMDMGFGSSRVEDEADMDETKVKLSAWDGDDDDEGGGGGGKKAERKRGGKKKKGDKNNFEDVMKVMQRQKGGS